MAQAKKTTRPRRKAPTPTSPAEAPDALAPGGGRGLVSLGQLLDNMGQSVAQVIVAPRGLDVQAGDPVIYDAIDRSTPEKDAIVLAVGVSPDGRQVWVTSGSTDRTAIYVAGRRLHSTLFADAAPQHVTFGGAAAYVKKGLYIDFPLSHISSSRFGVPIGTYGLYPKSGIAL